MAGTLEGRLELKPPRVEADVDGEGVEKAGVQMVWPNRSFFANKIEVRVGGHHATIIFTGPELEDSATIGVKLEEAE